jgi:hypothetical protein
MIKLLKKLSENPKTSKRNAICLTQMIPSKIISQLLSRNLAGQKVIEGYM